MLTDELRARIATLNQRARGRVSDELRVQLYALESLVPGESVQGTGGSFYRVRRAFAEFAAASLRNLVDSHRPAADQCRMCPEFDSFVQAFPARVLFLDLETCGFSGTPLFLIGLLRQADGELVVEQLLARTYDEEPAVLSE